MPSSLVVLLSVIALALGMAAWLGAAPLRLQRRRNQLRRQPFPQAWRRILRQRVPLVQRLPTDLQLRLKQDIQVFLAEKPIIGCAGLAVTDEMRVTLAAQACLPLLGARRGYYASTSKSCCIRVPLSWTGRTPAWRACRASSGARWPAKAGPRVRSCCLGTTC